MKIAVFGCSWSYGVPECLEDDLYACWPLYLQQQTGWEVKNFAYGGTSILWNLNNLLNFKKSHSDYFIIFQATVPYRFTYIDEDYNTFSNRLLYNTKYECYSKKPDLSLVRLLASKIDKQYNIPTHLSKYYKSHIGIYPTQYQKLEYEIQLNTIEIMSDLCFFHKYPSMGIEKHWPCMQQYFDKDFDNWVFDNGHHFNKDGLRAQAKYIKELVNASRTS